MCDVQGKLVAWIDGELPAQEVASVQGHVEECEECRERVAEYKRVSEDVALYCTAVVTARTRPRVLRWALPALACAAVAAGVLFVVFERTRVEPPLVVTPTIAAAVQVPGAIPAVTAVAPQPAQRRTKHKRPVVVPMLAQEAKWQPAESAVQIAIPAEAMFAPGAVPKGLNFVAELSIAPDGSVRQVRLRQ